MAVSLNSLVLKVGVGLGLCLAMSGCGMGNQAVMSGDAVPAGTLAGRVHGGQQPVSGAHVYLYEANATAYAGPGIAASTANASKSLLKSAANTTSDGTNFYVTTGSDGGFSIGGDYTCDSNQVVYAYAVGGNPGAGTNAAAGFLALVGTCPSGGGNLASLTPYVWMNELTTVAAAYAMAGFASDATHVGYSGSALGLTGIQNAFANAGNLVNVANGTAYATTPGSTTGNVGTVPQTKINTLGNILAACVNGVASSTSCTTLLEYATSDGVACSSAPCADQAGDTATAAIYLAHVPYVVVNTTSSNVAQLFTLQTAASPFQTALGAAPTDFALSLSFTGPAMNVSVGMAVDGSGNVWVTDQTSNALTKFSPLGVTPSGTTAYTGGGLYFPQDPAIDSSGNVWVNNYGGTTLSEFASTGTPVASSGWAVSGYTGRYATGIDGSGNVWVTGAGPELFEVYGSGTNKGSKEAGPFTGGGMYYPETMAIDSSGYVWISNFNGTLVKFSSAGVSQFGTTGLTVAGISQSFGLTFDASGNPWVADAGTGTVVKLNSSGTVLATATGLAGGQGMEGMTGDATGAIWVSSKSGQGVLRLSNSGSTTSVVSPALGYKSPSGYPLGQMIQVDGSGNLWGVDWGTNLSVIEFVGIAAPQYTPITPGKYASRP